MGHLDRSLIAGLSPFQGVAPADLDRMLQKARSTRIAKGGTVFEQEAEAQSFFLLIDGHVRVVKATPDGQQVIVRYISPGELMGIAQALGRSTYPASAIAAIDCVVLAWPGHLWSEFAFAIPSFGANTYKTVGTRLHDTHSRIVEMATEQVEQRIAHSLLRLVKQTGKGTDATTQIQNSACKTAGGECLQPTDPNNPVCPSGREPLGGKGTCPTKPNPGDEKKPFEQICCIQNSFLGK